MDNTIDKTKTIIDKIQKLLNLSENNPNSSEAESAMLKAQALMAEYNVSVAKSMDPEAVEKIVSVGCEHKKKLRIQRKTCRDHRGKFRLCGLFHGWADHILWSQDFRLHGKRSFRVCVLADLSERFGSLP